MHRVSKRFGLRCALVLVLLAFAALAAAPYQYPGTRRMAERLDAIWRAQDWQTDPYKNKERIEQIRLFVAGNDGDPRQWDARLRLASELLELGESAEAVKELETARTLARAKGAYSSSYEMKLRDLLGLAYLRLGEQENCLLNHTASSCIFPIDRAAMHTATQGAEGAIREFTGLLNANPDDLNARWLLNLAYMVLGRHPEGVPAKWLIPSKIYESDAISRAFAMSLPPSD